MTIDKSWTTLANRNCSEFFTGLDAFLERCKDYLSSTKTCRCPCENCDNLVFAPLSTLRVHIHRYGFSESYTTWRFHGEQYVLPAAHVDLGQTTGELHDYLNDVRQENTANEHNTDTDESTEGSSNTNDKSNTQVKAQQIHQSLHGRTACSQYRYQNRNPETGEPPSLIEQYARNYSRNGVFTHLNLQNNYRRMVELKDAQVGSSHPLSEEEIMTSMLGERRGHVRGKGRMVRSSSSSTSRSNAQSRPTKRQHTQTYAQNHSQFQDHMHALNFQLQEQLRAQQLQTKAIYEALRQAGINVNLPSSSQLFPSNNLADDEEDSD